MVMRGLPLPLRDLGLRESLRLCGSIHPSSSLACFPTDELNMPLHHQCSYWSFHVLKEEAATPFVSLTLDKTLSLQFTRALIRHGHLQQIREPGRYGRQEIHPLAGRGRREDPAKRARRYSGRSRYDQCYPKGTMEQPPALLLWYDSPGS